MGRINSVSERLHLSAHAKVNLYLSVLGRRSDGYHLVDTCLHSLVLADEITAELLGERVELTLESRPGSGLAVAADGDNLICRAAAAFIAAAGVAPGVRFTARKRIPAGAGLGGGSSDAAAALLLMNTLHGRPLSDDELEQVASTLGADVPFFLRGGTQIGRGVGDELTAVADAPDLHFLLLLPPFGLSTASVYQRCGARELADTDRTVAANAAAGRDAVELSDPARYANDLEPAAMALEPRLARLRDRVVALGYPQVRMSGSGSSLFIAFTEERDAATAAEQLACLADEDVVMIQTRSAGEPRREPRPAGDGEGN